MNIKKRLKIFAVLLTLTATVLLVECNVYFPGQIRVMNGESVEIPDGFAYTFETSGTIETNGSYDATVKLFGLIPVKDVRVSVLPEMSLVPGGKAVGIKMFTKGLICVGTEKLKGIDGETHNIAKALDIKETDIIISANGKTLHTVEEFADIVSNSDGNPVTLVVRRNGEESTKVVTPVKTDDGYKLGLWVRDSTAGIGTVTFTDSESGGFAALGHPITDVDTGILMPVDKGSINSARITGVKKGTRGEPGELYGIFSGADEDCGVILKNTQRGIYGTLVDTPALNYKNESLPVASGSQVKTGKAEIYANIEDDKIEKFEIEISKLMRYAPDSKNMIIKVTDKRLLDKTGGIVQGMSGSPIIQNGKIIGAVTHVFVNDPTRGYGIFIENMLNAAQISMTKAS